MTAPRLAVAADRDAVEEIVRLAYTPYIERIGRPPGPMNDDYGARIAAGQLHVLEVDGTVAAMVVLVAEPGILLLDNVAVHPTHRGQGLGRALIDFAERVARGRGFGAIRLYTNAAMTENLGLYPRLGFRETRRAEEGGLHRVHMIKVLT